MDRCTPDVDDLLDSFCGLPTPGTPVSSDPPSKVAMCGDTDTMEDLGYDRGQDKCSDTDTMADLGYDRGHLVDHDLDQPARHFCQDLCRRPVIMHGV